MPSPFRRRTLFCVAATRFTPERGLARLQSLGLAAPTVSIRWRRPGCRR
jgi:hypothetical protein